MLTKTGKEEASAETAGEAVLGDQTDHPPGTKTDTEEEGKDTQDPEVKVNMAEEETAVLEEKDQEEEALEGREGDLDIPMRGENLVIPSREGGIGVEEIQEGLEALAEEIEAPPEALQDSEVEKEGQGEKEAKVPLGVEAEVQIETATGVVVSTIKLLPAPYTRRGVRENVGTVHGSTDLVTAKPGERE